MPTENATETDRVMMKAALAEARQGYDEGGIPVGSVIAEREALLAAGRNRRVQAGNPAAHAAEADADFGDALAAVGDIDGDGISDLLVGAPLADAGGTESGEVRLLSGASGALVWFTSGFLGERFGTSVAGVNQRRS